MTLRPFNFFSDPFYFLNWVVDVFNGRGGAVLSMALLITMIELTHYGRRHPARTSTVPNPSGRWLCLVCCLRWPFHRRSSDGHIQLGASSAAPISADSTRLTIMYRREEGVQRKQIEFSFFIKVWITFFNSKTLGARQQNSSGFGHM